MFEVQIAVIFAYSATIFLRFDTIIIAVCILLKKTSTLSRLWEFDR